MTTTPSRYFDAMWSTSDDPWNHGGRWYEQRKYDLTVAVLPAARYRIALEPACGVGLLTVRLAERADAVMAFDAWPRAVAVATRRCRQFPHVSVEVGDIRSGPLPPATPADLVVLGEVLYYFDESRCREIATQWFDAIEPGGHLVAVHYRPSVAEHVIGGDAAHAVLRDALGPPIVAVSDPGFLLEVFERA
ncbi:MAG: methyltransferase domain-containing protein [Acidimicrobiia bacterium]|nr:methyltransferase domain-containing protein [Acidimicrobiia bacterium]